MQLVGLAYWRTRCLYLPETPRTIVTSNKKEQHLLDKKCVPPLWASEENAPNTTIDIYLLKFILLCHRNFPFALVIPGVFT